MSKESVPLQVADLSGFTRALSRQLTTAQVQPSHLELMNMLARAAGFRNYQHLRAGHAAKARLDRVTPTEPADHRLIERALQHFDGIQLVRWPSRRQVQALCLWPLWAALPSGVTLTEKQVNAALNARHLFGDPAILRREMWSQRMLSRNRDGSDYRRIERRPPVDALELMARICG